MRDSKGKPMKKDKRSFLVIIIALLILIIAFLNMFMVFRISNRQVRDSGTYRLQAIGGELESTINKAKNLALQESLKAQEYLDDHEKMKEFMYSEAEVLQGMDNGCFNIYVAGSDWDVLTGLDEDARGDFEPTERSWYTGAVKSGGVPFVASPYIDVITGGMCYTISVVLSDKDAVVALDYTMDNIQEHIKSMSDNGLEQAIIVTEEGIIAGCSDESLIGKPLDEVLPEYSGVYALAKSSDGVATAKMGNGLFYDNLSAARSGIGWYLIIRGHNWDLYKNSYIQFTITIVLSLALMLVIIALYVNAQKSRKKAEIAMASREEFLEGITSELREPLRRIMEYSSPQFAETTDNYKEDFESIHEAGEHLSEMIQQLLSYSSIKKTEKIRKDSDNKMVRGNMNVRFRTLITALMIFVMVISTVINATVAIRWGQLRMRDEVASYEARLSEWISTQKGILDMFSSIISTHPEMLDDYDGTVEFLKNITDQYPEISVTYMTDAKDKELIMSNGWIPDEDFHFWERPWYLATMEAEDGWSVSAPYYDGQTGVYCMTMSKQVYDYSTGEFLGNFGIDFYMDKLIGILGGSYSETGYAFLTDDQGVIINHPYGSYQMSESNMTNVSQLPYGEAIADGMTTRLFRDYDGITKIMIATRNADSEFTVYAVANAEVIYGNVVLLVLFSILIFIICIVMVYRTITSMITIQESANARMKESADLAIAAGKAKSRFLAQMSHEIRTPINAVLGMNEMILRESSDADVLDYASNIQSAGRTLLALINSILDFSKIEDGKMEIIPARYDLASMINNLVNSITDRVRSKDIVFDVDVQESLPAILYGDDVRITQVIMNLLTNAVKYTQAGSVALTIKEAGRENDNVDIYVEVRDTGIGIKQEDMSRLFESFERIEENRNRNIEGTGLGISIVTKLLEMMGSHLEVESTYGKGSVFSFTIRQKVIDDSFVGNYMERLAQSLQNSEKEKQHLFAPAATVLVVDDYEMNLKVVKNLMKLYGIIPDLASSGEMAIEMVNGRRYDIIFLDHMMPGIDGIETLKIMKERELLSPGTTVIALTANAVVGAREQYLAAGFDDYLTKPIEINKLEARLEDYLPGEKVSFVSEGAENENTVKEDDEVLEFSPEDGESNEEIKGGIERFEDIGINVKEGLLHCMNDEAFYLEMLSDYGNDHDQKAADLEGFYKEENWKDYKILVHAIKSGSKTVGIMELSEKAKDLEDAAAREDAGYIRKNHEDFMKGYADMVGRIKELIV